MYKAFLVAVSLAVLSTSAAFAQGWADTNATTGSNGMTWSNSPASRQEQNFYQQNLPGGTGPGSWMNKGTSSRTQNNGSTLFSPNNQYGPQLHGSPSAFGNVPGGSGAATGAPVIIGGFNTKYAPMNMSLMTQHHSPIGGKLPNTVLDSFVAGSHYNDRIYGDEGVTQEPPYFVFTPDHRIERGIEVMQNQQDLTTGHKSDAPNAWGWPN